ncbi:MAG: hypothetical protein ACR2LU_04485, partial [Luteitalea sp.]
MTSRVLLAATLLIAPEVAAQPSGPPPPSSTPAPLTPASLESALAAAPSPADAERLAARVR